MAIEYDIAFPAPDTHLISVEMRIPAPSPGTVVRMPVWTPGSYLIREFARNVQDFTVHDATGLRLAWRKIDKNGWSIVDRPVGALTIRYRVYANELSVRTSHLDATHGYINGASVFMYVQGREKEEARIRIERPDGWRVATSLEEDETDGSLVATDYDTLVDSPIEVGTHQVIGWDQAGIGHRYAVWGAHGIDEERLVSDTRRVIDCCAELFGGLPYDQYLFILHVVPEGRGGLEHRTSSSLLVSPETLAGDEYEKLISLVAHEFFHVWLGKRIRPEPLGPFDYRQENYTRNLWVVEGFTTYYTDLILLRAGLMKPARYLERLGAAIAQHDFLPGRLHQSLEDSSFDTWIKFYRPDAHTPNSQVSYYQKGALVAFMLDVELRRRTGGQRSLDDVMRLLWDRYGKADVGFPEDRATGIQALVEEVAGEEMGKFFYDYVEGMTEIDFDHYLEAVGLELQSAPSPATSDGGPRSPMPPAHEIRLGIRLRSENGRIRVTHVLEGTPLDDAGVNAGDEVVALQGVRATLAGITEVLSKVRAGAEIELTLLRRDRVMTIRASVDEGAGWRASIRERAGATPEEVTLKRGWLGSG